MFLLNVVVILKLFGKPVTPFNQRHATYLLMAGSDKQYFQYFAFSLGTQ